MKKPLIILTGPTAVGKTKASIGLAKALDGEIISAESMQVYKHMDIGSAKIRPEEMQGIKHYLKTNAPDSDKSPKVLTDPNYAELLSDILKPISREIAEWEQAPYIKNTKYPNQLRIRTVNGLTVRSKSESIIALYLYTHRIPFHYEEKLIVGGIDVYPDFTLRHPVTGLPSFFSG